VSSFDITQGSEKASGSKKEILKLAEQSLNSIYEGLHRSYKETKETTKSKYSIRSDSLGQTTSLTMANLSDAQKDEICGNNGPTNFNLSFNHSFNNQGLTKKDSIKELQSSTELKS
jgi:hypothetical protein